MRSLTLQQIAAWCGGSVTKGDENLIVTGVSRSSSEIRPGDLYVALQGQRFDGHSFIAESVRKGATAALSMYPCGDGTPIVLVENTLTALGDIAAGYRKTLPARVFGITGSVGKTTTKEMLAQILALRLRTCKTQENYNNNIGLPLTILSAPDDCEALVLEMGMNHFGEMSRLTTIAQPDIVIVGNIGTMHIENLGSREGILKAKLEILDGLAPDGTAVFNGDEPLLWDLRDRVSSRKLYFGVENEQVDLRATDISTDENGVSFTVNGFDRSFRVSLPIDGVHNVYNALAAIAAAMEAGASPEQIITALSDFSNTGMRQNTYKKFGYTIIDDSYNAGPESVEAALRVMQDRRCAGKKIAVLGDMLELGNRSSAEHYRIGRIAGGVVDVLLAYGKMAPSVISGAQTGGMSMPKAIAFDSQEELVNTLLYQAKPGDMILFKGSRGMKMELALRMFLEKVEKQGMGAN
jgi:UDP-N-acetylmuramoyl-tripeptide--D-alanyl-D-alanine ligase